jgi:hypothetical protein
VIELLNPGGFFLLNKPTLGKEANGIALLVCHIHMDKKD